MKQRDISKDILCVRMDCNMKQFVKELAEELKCDISTAVRLCILIGERELQDEFTGELKVLKNL